MTENDKLIMHVEADALMKNTTARESWRIFGIMSEFVEATERLRQGLPISASGPRSARAKRFTMLRKVILECGGHHYHGTIRNISSTGALVEGLWNVPPGTRFSIALTENFKVIATSRWNAEDKMGVEFSRPLETEEDGSISILVREKQTVIARAG